MRNYMFPVRDSNQCLTTVSVKGINPVHTVISFTDQYYKRICPALEVCLDLQEYPISLIEKGKFIILPRGLQLKR